MAGRNGRKDLLLFINSQFLVHPEMRTRVRKSCFFLCISMYFYVFLHTFQCRCHLTQCERKKTGGADPYPVAQLLPGDLHRDDAGGYRNDDGDALATFFTA
jgi:hypothetical protein